MYTYRIALVNRGNRTIRDVEVRLTSIEPKPHNFNSIGGNLQFRHELPALKAKDVPSTLQKDYMDAIFFDVFHYFLNDTGSGSWLEAVTTVPGQERNRDLSPLQNYSFTITATSRAGCHTKGEFEWIMQAGQLPRLILNDT